MGGTFCQCDNQKLLEDRKYGGNKNRDDLLLLEKKSRCQ